MATYNTIQNSCVTQDYTALKCDICNSDDIIETREGYVCRNCGIVLEVQKLQYDRPYNADLIQYATSIGATQIGTKRERDYSPISWKLERLNQYNNIIDNDTLVYTKARKEITRVLSCLGLGEYDTLKEEALVNFKEIRAKFKPGTKYRNVEMLVAIILYFRFRLNNISIRLVDLFNETALTRKEFNNFFTHVRIYFPKYLKRDRREYISQRIREVSKHFDLGMPFYHLSKKILYKLWELIKNSTDDVIAGLVCSISALCAFKDKVSINAICKKLGIRMSTIQTQVERKIFKQFKVAGFKSLIRSSDLLVSIMNRLGLIETHVSAVEREADIVEVILGNATQIFNSNDNFDYYCFALRDETQVPSIMFLKLYENPLDDNLAIHLKRLPHELLEFEVYKFYAAKDPPLVTT